MAPLPSLAGKGLGLGVNTPPIIFLAVFDILWAAPHKSLDNVVMSKLFISYSRTDEAFVRRLAAHLDNLGVDIWLDVEDIPAGMKWSTAIQEGLRSCDLMLLILSPDSMASINVEDEWQYYLDRKKPIIPILLRPADIHFQLTRIQYIDFHKQPYDQAVEKLHKELGRHKISLQPIPTQPLVSTPTRPRSIDLLPQPFAWIEIPGKGYSIAKYPVTNDQFRLFVEAGGYGNPNWWTKVGWAQREEKDWTQPRFWTDTKWNDKEQPVVGVSWYESVAFCLWLSDVTDEKIMLPTDDQWQYAAQGDDSRAYPWGNDWDCEKCNNSVKPCNSNVTTPVWQYEGKGDSPFGVVDMAGNVWEWCLTDYEDKSNNFDRDAKYRVLGGGSWNYVLTNLFRCDARFWDTPLNGNYDIGFRLAALPSLNRVLTS
ncbi:MAG: SUMF1/EgtB/PvdO family nonheme iron enzyme [Chloroflexota bacterium]